MRSSNDLPTSQGSLHQSILHLELCGPIAAGKTVLANLVKRLGFQPVLEDYRANPFLDAFYSDPLRHAFETEITFLLQHYHQIKLGYDSEASFVCDFSLILDLAFADVNLSGSAEGAFLAVYEEVHRQLPLPALVVHLQCSAPVLMERIRARKRAAEESITMEYLESVNNKLGARINELADERNLVTINSEKLDFVTDESAIETVLRIIRGALSK